MTPDRHRHCPHCLGNCPGTCWLPGAAGEAGWCIHNPAPRLPWQVWGRLLGTRRFWHRVFWGRPHGRTD